MNPNCISVSPVSIIRKYIGVKITNRMTGQDFLMSSFFAVRKANKAVRQPSSILNIFSPWNPDWQNGEAIMVNTGRPHGSRKRRGYLKE